MADEELESLTKAELEDLAAEQGIEVSQSMTKQEMIQTIVDAQGDPIEGDFTTPRITITAVSGRDEVAEQLREQIIADAAATGTADQQSLGGTGGTTITGGATGAGAGAGAGGTVTTGPA